MNDHISKFDTTKACDVQYYPDEIAITVFCLVLQTATGSDGIPYWVFKECARELCNIISVLINYSVNEGCVPSTVPGNILS